MTTTILSIIYLEPAWQETKACIEAAAERYGCEIVYVDRKGWGSLSEAINRGAKDCKGDLTWVVTNPTFEPDVLGSLIDGLQGFAAIHPAFASDHQHIRPDGSGLVKEVPYIELTAPLVRTEVLKAFPQDEAMPFWGNDLDWSHRLRQAGHTIAVHHGAELQHTYIRNNKRMHPVTRRRYLNRTKTDHSTRSRLVQKYGADWRNVLKYV